ncbi:terminase large subunit [Arcobacter roscoffensis]|uniref:Terminase large subunit n=1 Tax=Arcobacter roscoffensis TaxID=2961520 RepID=A0ABY5DZL5_9BACT|nr:terminase TerL endonuclease subunit [Arcobacter roscoffensis]UTJ05399.1 terminase large subunit [Arcobacter roscoffensis]
MAFFKGQEVYCYYEKTFERHYRDLEAVRNAEKPNLRYNKKLGKLYVELIQTLRHYKGKWAKQPLILEDWQKKVIAIAFGWEQKNSDGKWVRRFNTIFIFIPRKNGKTLLASAITIVDSLVRFEIGGEVVIFATKKKQAKLAWHGIEKMIAAHPDLKKDYHSSYGVVTLKKIDTTFDTLGRDSDTEDGLNVSVGVADEYHAHPDDSLYEVVESSQGAREQPLMMSITTSGKKITSPAKLMHDHAQKVLEGVIEDDNFFAFVAQPDKDDDPFDELTWFKANPNYGISVTKDYMERQAKQAKDRPEKLPNFKIKNLNIWTNSADAFIPYEKWQNLITGELAEDIEENFVQGFDLSITDDFSANARIYKIGRIFYAKMNYYIPDDNIDERARQLNVPLRSWVDQGYINATPGDVIDYDFIYEDMKPSIDYCDGVIYDAFQAKHLVKRFTEDGYEELLTNLPQGYLSLTSPTKFFKDLVKLNLFRHDGNPVTTWMVFNLIVLNGPGGNIKPDKEDPDNKIDGAAAIINALSYFDATDETSIYESRGLLTLN